MNSSLINEKRINAMNSREFSHFVNSYTLKAINIQLFCKGPDYTFQPTQTMLDYILMDEIIARSFNHCEILEEGTFSSTSDHLPIVCSLAYETEIIHEIAENSKWTAWHKANNEQLK